MAKMDNGAHALKYRPKKDERFKKLRKEACKMDMKKDHARKEWT
jgi:hypothetical protein